MAAAEATKKPMLHYALEYLALGYPVFPICSPLMGAHQHRREGRMVDCAPDKRGKNPMIRWGPYQERLPTVQDIRDWWTRWPNANIGMATGALSGVIVLDCDSGEARQLALARGGLERTPAVWTGTPGGTHFWMAHPGYEVRNFAKDIPGTDFRGDGGYVLLPPSKHWKGATYRWNEHTVGMSPAPVPEWLAELFRDKAAPGGADGGSGDPLDVEEMLRGFDQGERDTGLFKLAARFRHDDQPQAYAEALIQVAARNCRPPFDPADAVGKVRYVYDKYPAGGVGPEVVFDEEIIPPRRSTLAETAPIPSVFFRPISELLAMPEVEPDWLVDQLFTVGSSGWVAAEPKVGKSWVVLELAYALSTGMPFLGRFAVKQPRRVLYVQEEDSLQRVLRRLKKIIKGDPARRAPSDDYWRWSIRSGFKLDSPVWMEMLRQEIESFSAEVIILDVFNRLHGAKENDQQEMTAILNALIVLATRYGCSFIIVHHNRKPQQGDDARANQMIRGSGVLAGWAECSLYLKRSKDKDTIIVTPESKDTPELDDFTIALTDTENGGICLEIGEAPTKSTLSRADEEVTDAVQSLNDRGIGATAMEVGKLLGKDRSTVQARLKRLATAGYLTATPISDSPTPTILYKAVSR